MLATVLAVTISGAFVFGMTLVLLGTIRQLLAKRLGLDEGRTDWLLSALNLTLIPTMLISGILIDQFGVKNVFFIGSLVTAGAVFTLAVSSTPRQALVSILLLGAGGACLSTGSTVLMPLAFQGILGGNYPAAAQNLGNVFFGLGGVLMPTVADRLIERLGYKRTLSVLAFLCLLPALLAVLTTRDVFPTVDQERDRLAYVLGNSLLWLAGLVFFLYGPIETAVTTWAIPYLVSVGFREHQAARWTTGFWFVFLSARLLAAFLERGMLGGYGWIIVVLGLATAVALGNLAGGPRRVSAGLGLLALGAVLGPIFPTLVGILFHYFPKEPGTAYGAMFAIGAVGNLFVPPLIGIYARRTNVQHGLRIPVVLAIIMALVALVVTLLPMATS
jgi:fucose permease